MSRGLRTELPTVAGRETSRVVVELPGRQVGGISIEFRAAIERSGKIGDQAMLCRVLPHHKGAAEVRLPFLEYRAEIQIHNVIRADCPIAGLVVVSQQCMGA